MVGRWSTAFVGGEEVPNQLPKPAELSQISVHTTATGQRNDINGHSRCVQKLQELFPARLCQPLIRIFGHISFMRRKRCKSGTKAYENQPREAVARAATHGALVFLMVDFGVAIHASLRS